MSEAPRPVGVIRKRRDFLAAKAGRKYVSPGFVLQSRRRGAEEFAEMPVRFGLTATRRVGNAVIRNRARRRLRALARALIPEIGHAGYDYVLIARAGATISRDYAQMEDDLCLALRAVHKPAPARRQKA